VSCIATIPLSSSDYQQASQFAQRQSSSSKSQQVYLNTLAVLSMDFYLKLLGYKTDLAASYSCEFSYQNAKNVADLYVKNVGRFECRPTLPGDTVCPIPLEARTGRICYVVLQIDEASHRAKLLGFTGLVETNELQISQLKSSLEEWLECLKNLEQIRQVEAGNFFRFRSYSQSSPVLLDDGWQMVSGYRGINLFKLLNFAAEQIKLSVGWQTTQNSTVNIWVEVFSTNGRDYLPQNLNITILDEMGLAIMEAKADLNHSITFDLSGQQEDRFSVKIALGNDTITEGFLI